jgi:hypothetical protein
MRETWYILEDGSAGNPALIRTGDDGILAHEDGRKVAYGPHGPRSRGVDPEAERVSLGSTRELTAQKPTRGYKTRSGKAD